jgi:hypothetical protein
LSRFVLGSRNKKHKNRAVFERRLPPRSYAPLQFVGDVKDAADAFARKQHKQKMRLQEAAAAAAEAAAKAVSQREILKRGGARGGGIAAVALEATLGGERHHRILAPLFVLLSDAASSRTLPYREF